MGKDWSNLANNFDELQRLVTGDFIDKSIKKELSSIQDLGDVLELGCGSGNYTESLLKNSNSILATDVSEAMTNVAVNRFKNLNKIKVQQADCYNTGLKELSYDTVFMGNLIHVVSDPEKAIKEVYRVLKDKGKLVIVSFTADGMSFNKKLKLIYRYLKYFGKPPKGGTKFSLNKLKNFVESNGFKVDEIKLLGKEMSKAIFLIARKI